MATVGMLRVKNGESLFEIILGEHTVEYKILHRWVGGFPVFVLFHPPQLVQDLVNPQFSLLPIIYM